MKILVLSKDQSDKRSWVENYSKKIYQNFMMLFIMERDTQKFTTKMYQIF